MEGNNENNRNDLNIDNENNINNDNNVRREDNDAVAKWFAEFKELLRGKGIDTSDPVSGTLIRGYELEGNINNPREGEIRETTFYPVGNFKNTGKRRYDEQELPDISGGRSLGDYRNGTAIDNLSDDDIKKLYNLAKEGRLLVYGKDMDLSHGTSCVYVTDSGSLGHFDDVEMMAALTPDLTFRGVDHKIAKDNFNRIVSYFKAYTTRFTVANEEGKDTEIAAFAQYEAALIKSYFDHTEWFDNEQNTESFEHALRIGLSQMYELSGKDNFDPAYKSINNFLYVESELKKLGFNSIADALEASSVYINEEKVEFEGPDRVAQSLKLIDKIISGEKVSFLDSKGGLIGTLALNERTGLIETQDPAQIKAREDIMSIIGNYADYKTQSVDLADTVARVFAGCQLLKSYAERQSDNTGAYEDYFSIEKIRGIAAEIKQSDGFNAYIENMKKQSREEIVNRLSNPEALYEKYINAQKLNADVTKWFAGFKKELEENGIDLDDPVSSALIYGFSAINDNQSDKTTSYLALNEIKAPSFSNADDFTDGRDINYFKENLTAVNHLQTNQILKLYNLAKAGRLFFYDKNFDVSNGRHYCYIDDNGNHLSYRKLYAPHALMDREQAEEYIKKMPEELIPGISITHATDLFARIEAQLSGDKDHQTNEKDPVKLMNIFPANMYRGIILQDYFKNRDYYSTPQSAAYRCEMIKSYVAGVSNMDIKKRYFERDDYVTLTMEEAIKDIIKEKYGLEELSADTINAMAMNGCFALPDGNCIAAHVNPLETLAAITEVFADPKMSGKLILMDGTFNGHVGTGERLGVITDKVGKAVFSENEPTRSNDYSKPCPNNLEAPEPSDRLVSFVNSLAEQLEAAGINLSNMADLLRVKMFEYNNNVCTERLGLVPYTFEYNGKSMSFTDTLNSTNTGLQGEMDAAKGFEIANALKMNKDRLSQLRPEILHTLYRLMAAADKAELTVLKHGYDYSNLNPIKLDRDGRVEILPNEKELEGVPHRQGVNYSRGKNYAQELGQYYTTAQFAKEAENGKNPEYVEQLNKYTENAGVDFIIHSSESAGIDSMLDEAAKNAYASGKGPFNFIEDVKTAIPAYNANPASLFKRKLSAAGMNTLKLPEVKKRDIANRELLQKNAFTALAESKINRYLRRNGPRAALSEALTNDDLEDLRTRNNIPGFDGEKSLPSRDAVEKLINSSRTLTEFLFNTGDDIYTADAKENIERAILFLGSNLNPDSESYAQDLKRQQADILNSRLQTLIETEVQELFADYTDNDLVTNYARLSHIGSIFSVVNVIVDNPMFNDNEFINRDLISRFNDIAGDANVAAFMLANRMSLIANPIYSKFDISALDNPANIDKLSALNGALSGDPDARYEHYLVSAGCGYTSSLAEYFVSRVKFNAAREMNMNMKNLMVVDSAGRQITDPEVFVALKKGSPFFVFNRFNPEIVQAYRLNKNGETVAVDMATLPKVKVNGEKKAFADVLKGKLKEIADTNRMSGDVVEKMKQNSATGTRLLSDVKNLVSNNNTKKIDELYRSFTEHYRNGNTQYSYEGLRRVLRVPDNTPRLSSEEISKRRNLTARAAQAQVQFIRNVIASQPDEAERIKFADKLKSIDKQINVTSMYEFFTDNSGEQSKEKNKKFYMDFADAAPDKLRELITKSLTEKIELVNKFKDMSFSDEDVVEKYAELRGSVYDFALQYDKLDGIFKYLENNGAPIDPELKKKADMAQLRAYSINDTALFRINSITNLYYAYGLEDIAADGNIEEAVDNAGDEELKSYCNNARNYEEQRSRNLSSLISLNGLGGEKLTALFDTDGNKIGIYDYEKIMEMAKEGKKLIAFGGIKTAPMAVSFDLSSVPAKANIGNASEAVGNYNDYILICHAGMSDAINADTTLSEPMKELEQRRADISARLALICNQHDPDNGRNYTNGIAEEVYGLVAIELIHQMVSKANDNIQRDFVSRENFEETCSHIRDNDDFKEAVKNTIKNKVGKLGNINPMAIGEELRTVVIDAVKEKTNPTNVKQNQNEQKLKNEKKNEREKSNSSAKNNEIPEKGKGTNTKILAPQ